MLGRKEKAKVLHKVKFEGFLQNSDPIFINQLPVAMVSKNVSKVTEQR